MNANICLLFFFFEVSQHSHQPNFDEISALRTVAEMRIRAVDNPQTPPLQILSDAQNLPANVDAYVPNMLSLRRTIQRDRAQKLPPNPTILDELQEIPAEFRITKSGDDFLLYDSFDDRTWESNQRILMYTTDNNITKLALSPNWYLDGTFKVVPAIFYQLLVIMGSIEQNINGRRRTFAVPLVYALLTCKEEVGIANFFAKHYNFENLT